MAPRGQKLFTLEEARALLPRLRELLTALQAERREMAEELRALERLTSAMRANGHAAEAARREKRLGSLTAAIRGGLQQLAALGVEVKDVDSGLVDFPSLREGRIVYLCWRLDEPTIAYWHELDTGFLGREPLEPS
ncbi:MAG TPA: DUF2203 domain-containing protein [Thermomicrobiaceae bacterium]|nr:DUF2203 domain-containing protein [Thermomicrobiaceae bacterium]